MENDLEIIKDFITNATPKQLFKFISAAEQVDLLKSDEMISSMKRLFIALVFDKLNVAELVYGQCEVNIKQTRLWFNFCPVSRKSYLWINKKDAKNLPTVHIKIYDQYKDELLKRFEGVAVAADGRDILNVS